MSQQPKLCLTALALNLLTINQIGFAEANKISAQEAEKLYKQMVLNKNPNFSKTQEFKLEERTFPELWQSMQTQLFNVYGGGSILIKDKKVLVLIPDFSGVGPHKMSITDLDNDKNQEFIYNFSWGSGIPYSTIAIIYISKAGLIKQNVITCKFGHLSFWEAANHQIMIRLDKTKIGTLRAYQRHKFKFTEDSTISTQLKKKLCAE